MESTYLNVRITDKDEKFGLCFSDGKNSRSVTDITGNHEKINRLCKKFESNTLRLDFVDEIIEDFLTDFET